MFLNLKGDFPFLRPPQSRKMGKDLTFSLAVSTEKQKKNAPPNHQRTENDPHWPLRGYTTFHSKCNHPLLEEDPPTQTPIEAQRIPS